MAVGRLVLAVTATFAAFGALCLAAPAVEAATFYVAPTGNDANPGTMAQPFATMARGQQAAAAGDTVFFRGGTYRFVSSTEANGVALNKSGATGSRINYWAYMAEVPIFDFSGMTTLDRITGLRVTASWIHVKGLEIKLVPQNITTQNESWGIHNMGSNNIYEMLNLHHNMGPGLFIGGGGNNLVLNCDSHHNYDPKSRAGDGENADGFGCHPRAGDTGNVFRGIRTWWNSDDGYDSINALESCLVENSWAWYNGYLPDTMIMPMTTTQPGNGNGFKLGGYGNPPVNPPANPPRHTIRFSLSFLNRYAGFFANYHTNGHFFYNNTGFMNVGADFNMLGSNNVNTSVLRNNLAYGATPLANANGTDNVSNSWNLPVQVSDADFQGVSITGMDGPRQADGSLPVLPFMRLLPGSDLVDKGVNINQPFTGVAPDLGAFESGGAVAGSGGASGSGGPGGAGSGGRAGGSGGSGGGGGGGSGVGAGGSPGSPGAAGATAGATGGAAATGGRASGTGGAISMATGGAAAGSGGSLGTGGAASGATGGASSTGGLPGGAASGPAAGCVCGVAGQPAPSTVLAGFAVLALAALSLRRRR